MGIIYMLTTKRTDICLLFLQSVAQIDKRVLYAHLHSR